MANSTKAGSASTNGNKGMIPPPAAPASAAPAAGATDTGFGPPEGAVDVGLSDNAERFLGGEDFAEGRTWEGTIVDALITADTFNEGRYQVVYVLQLTRVDAVEKGKGDDALAPGVVVKMGEKAKTRKLRASFVGDLVWIRVGERKALDGGRKMLELDVKVAPSKTPGKQLSAVLSDSWKAAGQADPWNAPGAEGTGGVPF